MRTEDALLIVDPCHRVAVEAVSERLRAQRLRPIFARSRVEAWHHVARGKPSAYVIVPPVLHGDAFALLHRIRTARPAIAGAVVLGGPRPALGGDPRIVWAHAAAVAEPLRRAAVEVAALAGEIEDPSWDVVTGDVNLAAPGMTSIATLLDEASLRV